MTIPLDVLLRDSAYKLDQFKPAQINALQASITMKDAGKKPAPYVTCLVRGKPIKLTPEEAIRQLDADDTHRPSTVDVHRVRLDSWLPMA